MPHWSCATNYLDSSQNTLLTQNVSTHAARSAPARYAPDNVETKQRNDPDTQALDIHAEAPTRDYSNTLILPLSLSTPACVTCPTAGGCVWGCPLAN